MSASQSTSGINLTTGGDNPLARFSLPDLNLPPTGEAGLYGPPGPAGALNGYAGVAYGAYQTTSNSSRSSSSGGGQSMGISASNSGSGIGYGPITNAGIGAGGVGVGRGGNGVRVPNLEERLHHIRSRMAQATSAAEALSRHNSSTPVPVTLVSTSTSTSTTPVSPASIPLPPTPSVSTPVAGPSNSTPSTSTSSSTIPMTAREIAVAAAERRALRARGGIPTPVIKTSSGSTPSTPVASPLPSPAIPLPSLAVPISSASRPTSTATTNASSYFPPSTSSQQLPRQSSDPSYPRLIPLFDPTSPLSTTLYPNLLSSMPKSLNLSSINEHLPRELPSKNLLSDENLSEESLLEMSRLTRKGIEERLRVIVGFQKRLEDMAADMSKVLSVLPKDEKVVVGGSEGKVDGVEVKKEEEREVVDKGKTPIEGIHAPGMKEEA